MVAASIFKLQLLLTSPGFSWSGLAISRKCDFRCLLFLSCKFLLKWEWDTLTKFTLRVVSLLERFDFLMGFDSLLGVLFLVSSFRQWLPRFSFWSSLSRLTRYSRCSCSSPFWAEATRSVCDFLPVWTSTIAAWLASCALLLLLLMFVLPFGSRSQELKKWSLPLEKKLGFRVEHFVRNFNWILDKCIFF